MKQTRMMVIMLVMLGMVVVSANAGVIHATSATYLDSLNAPALDATVASTGFNNATDLAADSDDVYVASIGRIYRLPDAYWTGMVYSDWNDYTSVAVLPDSSVYAAKADSIWRLNADLTGGVQYMTVNDITDISVNSTSLYGILAGRIRSFPGSEVWGPYSDWNDYTAVTASEDYVYAFAAAYNAIWRYNPDLTGGIAYVTGVGGITDLATDGTILYGTSGGRIYSFPAAETWGPSSAVGDYTSLAVEVVPEPATIWMLGVMGGGVLWVRNRFMI